MLVVDIQYLYRPLHFQAGKVPLLSVIHWAALTDPESRDNLLRDRTSDHVTCAQLHPPSGNNHHSQQQSKCNNI